MFGRHIREIKTSFILKTFACDFRICVMKDFFLSIIQVLFTQYEYNEMFSLPPNVLRVALAENFSNEKRFCLGEMDDAAEAFENILKRLHFHLVSSASNLCVTDFCLTHKLFSMNIVEKVRDCPFFTDRMT